MWRIGFQNGDILNIFPRSREKPEKKGAASDWDKAQEVESGKFKREQPVSGPSP
jgi:hypothetical protein